MRPSFNKKITTTMSPMIQGLLSELNNEAASTRRMLERVPLEKGGFRPHEKSFEMGRLAAHVAELPGWIAVTLKADQLDFSDGSYTSPKPQTSEELLQVFDENVAKAKEALTEANPEDLMKPWTLRSGEHVIFTMPKAAVIRTFAMNHMIHHRGQLSVYLRLNDVPLPGVYGPSADEK